jgi:hypothetical protein
LAAPLVLDALVTVLPLDGAASTSDSAPATSTSSEVGSPVVTSPSTRNRLPAARRPVDMLVAVLKNRDTGPDFPMEVRTNVCSLLAQLVRNTSGENLLKVKECTEPILRRLVDTAQAKEEILAAAAKRLLDLCPLDVGLEARRLDVEGSVTVLCNEGSITLPLGTVPEGIARRENDGCKMLR